MPSRPLLLVMTVLCWGGLVIGVLLQLPVVRVVFGIPAALVLPGLLVYRLLALRLGALERCALIGCGSVTVLIATVLLVNITAPGITALSVLVALGVCTGVLLIADLVLSGRHRTTTTRTRAPARRPGGRSALTRRARRSRIAAWACAAVIATGSLSSAAWLSITTESEQAQPHFTQLSLIPETGDHHVLVLNVHNMEGVTTTYRLQITVPAAGTTAQTVTLASSESYVQRVVATSPGQVIAQVEGGSPTDSGSRVATAVVP